MMPPSPPPQEPPVIPSQDVLDSLPAPVVRLLVIFSRPIHGVKVCLEVLCWKKGRRVESWMIVGAWWGLCLGSEYVFRYLAPPLLFLPLIPLSRLSLRRKSRSHPSTPHTHQTLLHTLSDLHAINALLPPSPIPTISDLYARFRQLGARRLLRGLIVIWSTWLILGRLIGFTSLLAILGTTLLLVPSPPFAHLFNLLSKSLIMRRLAALIFLMAFGSPPDQSIPLSSYFSPVGWAKRKWATSRRPSLAFSFRPTSKSIVPESAIVEDDEHDDAVEPIYFKFEVHENQRWWMGLDWTSALLPNERPSWCNSHLLPVLPPVSFSLPPSSSIILPSTDKAGGRIKRTATWRWYDDDWSIVRAGAAASTTAPVPVVAPVPEDEGYTVEAKRRSFSGLGTSPSNSNLDDSMTGRAHSMAEQAFTKGLERLKARTTSPTGPPSPKAAPGTSLAAAVGSPSRTSGEFQRARKGSQASEDIKEFEQSGPAAPVETIAEKDDATDADGWVYGDNKWENMGPKGGLGRFTRRRRWQRRAVLTETIQHLPPGPLDELTLSSLKSGPAPTVQDKKTVATARISKGVQEFPSPVPEEADLDLEPEENGHAHELERQLSQTKSDGSKGSKGSGEKQGAKDRTSLDGAVATGVSAGSRDDALRMRLKKAMGNMGA